MRARKLICYVAAPVKGRIQKGFREWEKERQNSSQEERKERGEKKERRTGTRKKRERCLSVAPARETTIKAITTPRLDLTSAEFQRRGTRRRGVRGYAGIRYGRRGDRATLRREIKTFLARVRTQRGRERNARVPRANPRNCLAGSRQVFAGVPFPRGL